MEPTDTTDTLRALMMAYAERSGLSNRRASPRRYLWTDAFAVCNFLTLYRRSGEERYLRLALDLIDQVHAILGRHREDDPRTGWISGLDDVLGARHPTAGGLRIGKTLNERKADDPYDDRLEWDRDGQYFHYLSKWMHTLARVAAATEEPKYIQWALELATAAHAAFAYAPLRGGTARMYWKMSIDLSRPLVPSMGLHDPLDAFVTYSELRYCARRFPGDAALLAIEDQIAEAAAICEGMDFVTDDPLGLGGLLFDACRLTQMMIAGSPNSLVLLKALLQSSKHGLDAFLYRDPLHACVQNRLAFRELGLSIGLRAIQKIRVLCQDHRGLFNDSLFGQIESLAAYEALIETIERFWCGADHQQSPSWRAHSDINMVMLATSLDPEEFLTL